MVTLCQWLRHLDMWRAIVQYDSDMHDDVLRALGGRGEEASGDVPVLSTPQQDPFLERVSQERAGLLEEEARLAEEEESIRRRRAELRPRISDLERALQVYRDVMGLPAREPTDIPSGSGDSEGKSIADQALAVMQGRGGRMRVADLVEELAARRSQGLAGQAKSEYATVYRTLSRDRRFAKVGPGEFRAGPSDAEVLEAIASLQLRFAPPEKFVGLNFLATDRGWRAQLTDLIERRMLVTYKVPNPNSVEHPTTAVRVSTDSPDARTLLGLDWIADLESLHYDAPASPPV